MARNRPRGSSSVMLIVGAAAVALLVALNLLARTTAPPRRVAAGPRDPIATAAPARPAPPAPVVPARLDRNLFRPLVVRQETRATPAPPPSRPAAPPSSPVSPPPTPPSVTDRGTQDLAMVGVIELGDTPRVLLRHLVTGESRYLARGEECWGFTVAEIHADRVVLTRNDRRYTLGIADKEIPGASPARSPFAGGGPGFRRPEGSFFDRDRFRGERDRRREGGSDNPLAEVFRAERWSDRLRLLEQIKDRVPAEQYERLHRFFSERVQSER